MNLNLGSLCAVGLACFAMSATTANAQSYTFSNLGTLGGSMSQGYAINNAGQVVGYVKGNKSQCSQWSKRSLIPIGPGLTPDHAVVKARN